MAIGTSTGDYYNTLFEFHAKDFRSKDNNTIIPDTQPNLQTSDDNIDVPNTLLGMNPGVTEVTPIANIPKGSSSNIEDRRDDKNSLDLKGMKQGVENTITEMSPLWAAEKMQPYKYGKNLEQPDTPLSNALGGQDIGNWANAHRTVGEQSPLDSLLGTLQDDAHQIAHGFDSDKEHFFMDHVSEMTKSPDIEDRQKQKLSTKEMDELSQKNAGIPGSFYLADLTQPPETQMSKDLGSSDLDFRQALLTEGKRRLLQRGRTVAEEQTKDDQLKTYNKKLDRISPK